MGKLKLQLQQQQHGIVYQVILRLHIYERGIYQETIHSRNNTETVSMGDCLIGDQSEGERLETKCLQR